jgi:multidrug resistance protein MdtO
MFPLAHFLRQELRDAPGRASYTLRLTLSCAVLITLFMTLQIPGRRADRRVLRQPA